MLITNLTYTRRKPVEQYGYEELSASAALNETDVPGQCASDLRNFINGVVFSDVTLGKTFEAPKPKVKNMGREEKQTEAPVEEEPQVEVAKEKKKIKKSKETTVTLVEKPAPEVVEVDEAPAKVNKKHTIYNRELEVHKQEFKVVLSKVCPHWKDLKSRAKDLSEELAKEKVAFLDENGVVLPEFEAKVREYMNT